MNLLTRLFYALKPIIPRWPQILLRRAMIAIKRPANKNVWPIDEVAGGKPKGWSGWPERKRFSFVLMHDVDTKRGHDKCRQLMELDEAMGFRSLFSFVPEGYPVSPGLRRELVERGFEVGVHGLKHDGKLFLSREKFCRRAVRINRYLNDWESVGFVSPSMHRNLDWMHDLNIEYDASTFDTDPFEPQPDGVATIFPFPVHGKKGTRGFVELPYTLPQDFTLFVLMKEKTIDIWKKKLDWIAEKGGMALVITHPDYMNARPGRLSKEEYPMHYYAELLKYVKTKYEGQYWHVLPKEMASFWRENMSERQSEHPSEEETLRYYAAQLSAGIFEKREEDS
jgi:peptidoglycan/xylan/chitin deacetylase (PgdA/CDA1 family)